MPGQCRRTVSAPTRWTAQREHHGDNCVVGTPDGGRDVVNQVHGAGQQQPPPDPRWDGSPDVSLWEKTPGERR